MDDIDYDLIFGISNHAVDAEVHAPDNYIPELSKLTDESSSTPQEGEPMDDSPLEREQLDSNTLNDEEHSFEGEQEQLNAEIKGEHVVEEEHNVDDACSNAGSEYDEIFEDAPLEFDPAYPPMEKWTRDHPKDQVIGNPQEGVLTRAQIRAQNEAYVKTFDSSIPTGILLPREAKKSKKSKKDEPTSPAKKAKGSTSSKSTTQKQENVVVTIEATTVITPVVEESQEDVVVPSKIEMFRRINMKSKHKRKSSSKKLLRKPQLSHQGVMFREVPVPVSPASKKRVAEDMAKHLSHSKKKKTKKARKIVSSSESTEEDERVPETPETTILTSSIPETTVIFTPEVSIAKSIFEEEVKKVREDVNLKIQELHEEMNKEIIFVQHDYASLHQKVDIICDAVTKFVKMSDEVVERAEGDIHKASFVSFNNS
ncbi:unnamed protein product [Lactuca saligna]|uniref:Uncharacterized protein n=1 Tax=Lactuca saligna TaxID=75948 RepID=A0AA35XZL2_LACSI|nr:unnamed protein product [Lactuca saligna]